MARKETDVCVLFGANSTGLGDFPSTGVLICSLFPNYQRSLREERESSIQFFFQENVVGSHGTRHVRLK
jgi:hypothetical protein